MSRLTHAAALALIVGLGTLGCSTTGDSPSPSTPGTPSAPASATGTSLTITSDGATSTLTCDPSGGTLVDPAAACDFLAAAAEQGADPFAPVPADRACAEVYGGPQTATVTGTWLGEPVSAEFSRTDACQTARWDQAEPLLGAP